uniref:Uncharacterized protein n=1 Tax=Physcomitrium patens TaxID=3218 RepID=A0A2K1IQS0_PHYPA|nr:hypothetical protein PHYPA_025745 [Physcomitrium patens]
MKRCASFGQRCGGALTREILSPVLNELYSEDEEEAEEEEEEKPLCTGHSLENVGKWKWK